MVDPCIYGMADPVSADIGNYVYPIVAVFAGGECGATESVFLFGLSPELLATLSNLSLYILLLVTYRK